MKSEVLTREWRHVDFKTNTVRLDRGEAKNKEPRVFVMTKELRTLLEELHAKRKPLQPRVFVRPGGEPIRSLAKAFKGACKRAGHPGFIPHDLRRSAVRRFVGNGIPDTVAMKLTGHKTRSVFDRHNIVSDDDLRQAAARLDAAEPPLRQLV